MWHSFTYYILGVRPEYDGLKIDPKPPSQLPGLTMERYFRGNHYMIEVSNPDEVGQGVKSISLDGKVIKGNLIKLEPDGRTHRIKVLMGS